LVVIEDQERQAGSTKHIAQNNERTDQANQTANNGWGESEIERSQIPDLQRWCSSMVVDAVVFVSPPHIIGKSSASESHRRTKHGWQNAERETA
jgi:hypothetical protein